jgi:hypothetical protein
MKIALASDLHLEFGDINLKNTEGADVLILSGDIMVADDLHSHPAENIRTASMIDSLSRNQERAQRFRDFLKRCSFQFPDVVYVAGNHEFYHGSFPDAIDWLKTECDQFPNIHFLEMDQVTIKDFTFVGGTLWTDMNGNDPITLMDIGNMMNDFRIVRNSQRNYARFSPKDASIRHAKTLNFIKTVVESGTPDQKFVVVGHHSPSFQSVHEMYKTDTIMNGGYSTRLDEFILDHPQIKLWTHGHTHHEFDYMIGSTRIKCNPRGYINYEKRADDFELEFLDI